MEPVMARGIERRMEMKLGMEGGMVTRIERIMERGIEWRMEQHWTHQWIKLYLEYQQNKGIQNIDISI